MKAGNSKKSIVIASVTVGLIGLLMAKVLKKALAKSPFAMKLSQYKKVGLNSVKDFLELGELKLRLEEFEGGIKPIYDGIKILWDSDGSKSYSIIISPEYISKAQAVNLEGTLEYNVKELKELKNTRDWTRKITITSKRNKYSSNYSENEVKTEYLMPFEKFQCRIVSSNARVSRLLTYPTRRKHKEENQEIKCWITKVGNNNYLHVLENKDPNTSKLHDYKVVLYMIEGKGLVKHLPKVHEYLKFHLGVLPPCLCYISAMRSIGAPLEQYVGWIGEAHVLQIQE